MQVRDIVLAMRRVEKLDEEGMHKFTGYLDVVCESKADNIRTDFPGAVTYRQAVTLLATAAKRHLGARLFLLRLDQRPQQVALQLDGSLSKMVREDPVAFMRLMDPTMGRPQKLDISMSVKKEHSAAIKPNPLPAGYDTLAEAFGDDVYCRMKRGGATECPFCGRWGRWQMDAGLHCKECGVLILGMGIVTAMGGWFKIRVPYLLEFADFKDKPKLFIPRAWNENGPWISVEDLRQRYDEYTKEKEQCSRMHKADTSA
jgi:hypothetical protein